MEVSPLKLQKILYYSQAWYLVFSNNERTLFSESPEAWVNGPVYPRVFNEYRYKVSNMRDNLTAKDFDAEDNIEEKLAKLTESLSLSPDEIECLDSVITMYGAKTQDELVAITHNEKPWVDARAGLLPYEPSNNKIPLQGMFDYYNARYQKNRTK